MEERGKEKKIEEERQEARGEREIEKGREREGARKENREKE